MGPIFTDVIAYAISSSSADVYYVIRSTHHADSNLSDMITLIKSCDLQHSQIAVFLMSRCQCGKQRGHGRWSMVDSPGVGSYYVSPKVCQR